MAVAFRDLPGMAMIEAESEKVALGQLYRDEREHYERAISAKSIELFGIDLRDTYFDFLPVDARPSSEEEWERHFEFLEFEYDEEDSFWEAFGLDVTDGTGEELVCLDYFGRQLVCALKGIHPGASASFLHGEKSPSQIEEEARRWGEDLLRKK